MAHFIAFALVGILGTAAHYAVLYLLVEYYAYTAVSASGWGALCGLVVNYGLNYHLTFKSSQSHLQTFPKFAAIALLGLGLNLILMTVFTAHFYYLIAQIITTSIVLIWNFFANRLWTFQIDMTETPSTAQALKKKSNPFNCLNLILCIVAIRLLTLGLYPLYDPSESRYAEMGRKMLETGDWITPLIDYGVPFWGKPPLSIWLTATSLGLGGVNDFFVRLPSFLLSLGIGWIIFHLASVQHNKEYAWNALMIMASSVLFFVMAGTVATDLSMSFGIALALASFWLALREQKVMWGYLFFVGLSIGLLAKGPITLVLSGITIGLWTLICNEWRKIWQRIPWITGTMLMLCISVPWFLIAEQKTPGFLNYFIIGEHWKRFTESGWQGDLYGNGHARPHGMIWIYGLAATFPWCLILLKQFIGALLAKKLTEFTHSNDGWKLYCALWMLSPLLFFTLSANIIWTYALPSLPGFALLLAATLKKSKFQPLLALSVPLAFLILVSSYQFLHKDFYKSQQRLVSTYQHTAKPLEKLFYFVDRPYSAQFYTQGNALELKDISALQQRVAEPIAHYYIVKKDHLYLLPELVKQQLIRVQNYGKYTLFQRKALTKN